MIREYLYMQYFCGLSSFTSEPIFDLSLFVTICKRLGNETFDQMNQEIIGKALGIKRPSCSRIWQIGCRFYLFDF